ncbi:hypothetical protein SAY87_010093 [Trapa incisa]|uniref:Uncharacterized protein n=1 Tax=Trapa incisa TaxID=236973 RepID=A0AAN7JAN0_9MYRT|nr:hypothetical protein SAY87_010093 [Trapa incisa]
MDNGVEPNVMDEAVKRLEDEVRRVAVQAKELQEAASSLIAKSSNEEQSIRQRAASLDSTFRCLRSSIDTQLQAEAPRFPRFPSLRKAGGGIAESEVYNG